MSDKKKVDSSTSTSSVTGQKADDRAQRQKPSESEQNLLPSQNPENLPPHLRNVPPQLRDAVDDLVQKSSKGLGVTHKQKPVSVMLPPEIDVQVKAMPNRSDFIRAAVIEKLEREKAEASEQAFDQGEQGSLLPTESTALQNILPSASCPLPSLQTLEEIRDRVLMRKPPKERGKLRTALNEFIKEIRRGEEKQSIAPP